MAFFNLFLLSLSLVQGQTGDSYYYITIPFQPNLLLFNIAIFVLVMPDYKKRDYKSLRKKKGLKTAD